MVKNVHMQDTQRYQQALNTIEGFHKTTLNQSKLAGNLFPEGFVGSITDGKLDPVIAELSGKIDKCRSHVDYISNCIRNAGVVKAKVVITSRGDHIKESKKKLADLEALKTLFTDKKAAFTTEVNQYNAEVNAARAAVMAVPLTQRVHNVAMRIIDSISTFPNYNSPGFSRVDREAGAPAQTHSNALSVADDDDLYS
jgi:hypothetical protein